MKKKVLILLTVSALVMSMFTACGRENTKITVEKTASAISEQEKLELDKKQVEAENLLKELKGTYQELWPVLLADEYKQEWLENCREFVGEAKAKESAEMLASMVTGKVYGQEAIEKYKDSERTAFFCGFTQSIHTISVDENSIIKGFDKKGQEVFSHRYHYVGMEDQRGLYEFESEDKDSGEFTYFLFAPDTMESTYHIEFRYGSNLEALGQYDSGDYAYWLASGISNKYDQMMIEKCIHLFCKENLSEQ